MAGLARNERAIDEELLPALVIDEPFEPIPGAGEGVVLGFLGARGAAGNKHAAANEAGPAGRIAQSHELAEINFVGGIEGGDGTREVQCVRGKGLAVQLGALKSPRSERAAARRLERRRRAFHLGGSLLREAKRPARTCRCCGSPACWFSLCSPHA